MSSTVPVATSLDEIYTPDVLPSQLPRWRSLYSTFASLYGHAPAFVARSPGRVNLIGEHIDYSLYPVLPMAISADALLATSWSPPASPTHRTVRIANASPDRYPARRFDVVVVPDGGDGDAEIDVGIDASVHEWSNYFRAGLAGALRLLRKRDEGGEAPAPQSDLCVLVDGTVPVGGGLSSSAAFVSASALAVLVADALARGETPGSVAVDRKELTELAIVSERAVGVNSGGMDQSASVLSERGAALLVSFHPQLDARPVRFPATSPRLSFVVAQSFVTSNKQVTAPVNYNLRVVECTLAAAWLHAVLNPPGTPMPEDASPLGVSLRGFHEAYFAGREEGWGWRRSLREELEALVGVVKDTLTKREGYTRAEIARTLGVGVQDLELRFMTKMPIRADFFKLRQRALHVYSEALRAQQFASLLDAGGPAPSDLPAEFGRLLDESHASCRELYECSCPELDGICEIARGAGALGSRVTGAGWGGASVHLVPEDSLEAVTRAWREGYYDGRGVGEEEMRGAMVVTKPECGSVVFFGEA